MFERLSLKYKKPINEMMKCEQHESIVRDIASMDGKMNVILILLSAILAVVIVKGGI